MSCLTIYTRTIKRRLLFMVLYVHRNKNAYLGTGKGGWGRGLGALSIGSSSKRSDPQRPKRPSATARTTIKRPKLKPPNCTPYKHAPCHLMQSHKRKVYACLAVTCHLHFWQNDRDLLRATAVTRGWNGYRNKSQHRKSTLERKKILPPLLQGFESATWRYHM